NHVLGMVRQWQTLFYDHRYSNTVLDDSVDFVKVAEGLGAMGIRANTLDEFEAAMKTALTAGRPVVIDVTIAGDDKVWPMVAPGAAIDTCFSEDDM
ncbi:thiamine pyrophosphate-dependent enzyme, partial [Coprococcus sp. ART55/1]